MSSAEIGQKESEIGEVETVDEGCGPELLVRGLGLGLCYGCGEEATMVSARGNPMCARCKEEADVYAEKTKEPWTVCDWLLLIFVLLLLSDLGWDLGRVLFGGGAQ